MECKIAVTELKKILEAQFLGYPNDRDPYTINTAACLTGTGAILTAQFLEYPNDRDPYTINTDACLTGIGAILTNKERRIELLHMLAKL